MRRLLRARRSYHADYMTTPTNKTNNINKYDSSRDLSTVVGTRCVLFVGTLASHTRNESVDSTNIATGAINHFSSRARAAVDRSFRFEENTPNANAKALFL